MITTIQEVDFWRALKYLRDTTPEYGAPAGDEYNFTVLTGQRFGNTLTDLKWSVNGVSKPTEQQMIDAYNAALVDDAALQSMIDQQKTDHAAIRMELDTFSLDSIQARLSLELLSDLIKAFQTGTNPPDADTVYAGFVAHLNGTSLEAPITNYVTMMSGLVSFGVGIPTSEKQTIMPIVIDYLLSNMIVWIGKNNL